MDKRKENREHRKRIDGIVDSIFLQKGSQRRNKKMDKRNEKGEHRKRIDGIVDSIVYFERFSIRE